MFRLLSTLVFSLAALTATFAQTTASPAGRWYTIDDETGERKSVIEIYRQGNGYAGKIAEILTDNKTAVCDKCTGKQKGQPLLGLVILRNLVAEDDYWAGGTILDPQKGAEYKLSAWYEDDNPDVLFIRGKHWTGLYRTQEWRRVE